MDKLTEELEIAQLVEKKAKALRISEKEIEGTRAMSSRASTVFGLFLQ